MSLTYLDAGVLIAAGRGTGLMGRAAIAIIDDPARTFASSEFVRLEILPKALYYQQSAEVRFYQAFFMGVSKWAAVGDELIERAFQEAVGYGLSGFDALHVASALMTGAAELITTERSTKPIHRVRSLTVISIHPSALATR